MLWPVPSTPADWFCASGDGLRHFWLSVRCVCLPGLPGTRVSALVDGLHAGTPGVAAAAADYAGDRYCAVVVSKGGL
ncbi:hypothetical protein D3C77_678130 [compost metagenome]